MKILKVTDSRGGSYTLFIYGVAGLTLRSTDRTRKSYVEVKYDDGAIKRIYDYVEIMELATSK